MFSFHKPRVYRSSEGCCICRAKTSSSRFIESKKYERDAMKCFLLEEPRKGEICNACVLLVKRYKRLPVGSNKNWGHVVDARGGTSTKAQKNGSSSSSTSNKINSGSASNSVAAVTSSNSTTTSRSLLPEKFAKIFKKTKKVKNSKKCELQVNRKITNSTCYDINGSSLPTTPDSVDSDCEDGHYAAPTNLQTGTYVEFQTQTRASSYRTRKNSSVSIAKSESSVSGGMNGRRRSLPKLGSKRRKCYVPHKRTSSLSTEDTVQFFDENEWQKRKTCCGVIYECAALSNAILIQNDDYQPCEEHKMKAQVKTVMMQQQQVQLQAQKPIATLPAVVQIQTSGAVSSASSVINNSNIITSSSATSNLHTNVKTITTSSTTPVLKKHHLFFKRQSESFPHSDINNSNIFHAKTEYTSGQPNQITITSSVPASVTSQVTITSSTNTPSIPYSSQNAVNHIVLPSSSTPSSSSSSLSNSTVMSSNTYTATTTTTPLHYMPRHSSAKITTIATPLTAAAIATLPLQTTVTPTTSKSQHFLHKIKAADSGKVVKHSMDKINSSVRIKPSDLQDMKHVIKTVDKSYVLAKPATITPVSCTNINAINHLHQQQQYHHSLSQTLHGTTVATGASSPSALSSSSTSSSTKFSDNSSDSGFDENMLDRKSASPLQEDTERKIITRPGVHTMFLSSGVQIQGQHQNLVLTGNEVAAKIIQNRRTAGGSSTITVQPVTVPASSTAASSSSSSMHHHQQYTNNNRATPTTTLTMNSNNSSTVKIAQIIGAGVNGNINGGSHVAKMRAIYNNNTIQHENGVTTIVPASSLAATTQTAAMNAIAPSTVTITPAPMHGTGGGSSLNGNISSSNAAAATAVNTTNNKNKKISSNNNSKCNNNTSDYQNQNIQNLIGGANITPANLSIYNLQQQQQQQHHHHHQQQQQNANQKIILLKSTPPNMTTSSSTTVTTKYTNSSSSSNNNNNSATQSLINKTLLTSMSQQNFNATQPPISANINIKTRP